MNIAPKIILDQLVKNNNITSDEANRLEVESLKKNLDIQNYLEEYSNIIRLWNPFPFNFILLPFCVSGLTLSLTFPSKVSSVISPPNTAVYRSKSTIV